MAQPTCEHTGLKIPECSCQPCLIQFMLDHAPDYIKAKVQDALSRV